jgi:Flp pilus assembly protein TadD
MGDYEKAHKDFDEAISKDRNNPKFWHAKGLAYDTKALKDPKNVDHELQELAV